MRSQNYSSLLPPTYEFRSQPQNLSSEEHYLFQHEFSKLIDPCLSARYHQILVLGGSLLSFRYGFLDLSVLGLTARRPLKSRFIDLLSLPLPLCSISKFAVYPYPSFGVGYFHWFADWLPIIQLARNSFPECNTLVLPQRAKKFEFVRRSLENFGFNIFWSCRSRHIKVSDLCVIGPVAQSGNYRSELFRQMLSTVKKSFVNLPVDISFTSHIIYISRRDAPRRFLVNEDDVTSLILSFGGRVATLEGMTLQEQYLLFSSCSLLIGLHGAGLTNMIWMPPHASVLEIRNDGDSSNNCYFSMASVLNLRYFYSLATCTNYSSTTYTANLVADIENLQGVIHAALP